MASNMASTFLRAFLIFLLAFLVLVQGQVPGDLRLSRNGMSRRSYSYGRLQVYIGGQWGEVCGDDFTKAERDVACHQLGFIDSLDNNANNSYGNDVGNVMLSEVDCLDNNDYLHLLRCSYKTGQHSCTQKYVSLYCNSTYLWETPYNGQLRLRNSNYPSEGTVQVYCNGVWGTICTRYNFNREAADLVCRQLGYTSAKKYGRVNYYYYYSSTPVWLDSLSCQASSSVCLGSCSACPTVRSARCSHYYDLTIQCVYEALHFTLGSNVSTCDNFEMISRPRLGEVRLTSEGVAQVVYGENNNTVDNSWVPICGSQINSINQYNAGTICQQLGYNQVNSYRTVPSVSPNDRQFNVDCTSRYYYYYGYHPHILWCPRTFTTCNTSLVVSCGLNTSAYYLGQVRLVGGDYPSEGRVEVYDGQRWATVYFGRFSYNAYDEANSICRQLGYTGASNFSYGTIPGSGSYIYEYPYCYSSQQCFSRCLNSQNSYITSPYGYHQYDLFVNCTFLTSAGNVIVGYKTACQLISTQPSGDNHTSAILAGVLTPIAFIILLIVMTSIVILCICKEKKANRRRREETRGGVRYTTNTATGQNVAYVVPATGTGYMTTPQGMVLVPVVPATTANNQVVPTASNNTVSNEEEKTDHLNTEEYFPSPTALQS